MSQIPAERIQKELNQVKDEVAAVTGQKEMHYLRAPRGIFSTKSDNVGRNAEKVAPRVERRAAPSPWPMMSSWAMKPECVWNSPPSSRVTR